LHNHSDNRSDSVAAEGGNNRQILGCLQYHGIASRFSQRLCNFDRHTEILYVETAHHVMAELMPCCIANNAVQLCLKNISNNRTAACSAEPALQDLTAEHSVTLVQAAGSNQRMLCAWLQSCSTLKALQTRHNRTHAALQTQRLGSKGVPWQTFACNHPWALLCQVQHYNINCVKTKPAGLPGQHLVNT
jgi:hypothetical protein